MREIAYRKKQSLKNRCKVISITENSEDNECKTMVRKSFVYILTEVKCINESLGKPEIFIRKSFDTRLRDEKFNFRVKGGFYMTQERDIFKVDFCHTLNIHIKWKGKIFSPKKSATLT